MTLNFKQFKWTEIYSLKSIYHTQGDIIRHKMSCHLVHQLYTMFFNKVQVIMYKSILWGLVMIWSTQYYFVSAHCILDFHLYFCFFLNTCCSLIPLVVLIVLNFNFELLFLVPQWSYSVSPLTENNCFTYLSIHWEGTWCVGG